MTFRDIGAYATVGNFGRGPEHDLAVSSDEGGPQLAVAYGSPQGLTTTGLQTWSKTSPGVPGRAAIDERFGYALAAGRFSASGYDDLALGTPFRTVGKPEAGAVVVLSGSAEGLTLRGARE